MTEKLKPCPFCGGEARLVNDTSGKSVWTVSCESQECYVSPEAANYDKAEWAIAAWNRRPEGGEDG